MISIQYPYVGSEVGQLKQVLLHHPSLSLDRLTPSNSDELLFDDVLKVETAEKEHEQFAQLLRDNGVEVLLLKDLLADTIKNKQARDWLLERQCSAYFLGTRFADEVKAFLRQLTHQEMADYLLGGITCYDFKNTHNSLIYQLKSITDFIIPPLPNHLFTRDTSCWIYNGVSINPMAKPARKRETANLRAIYNFHPLFTQAEFNFWYGNNDRKYENATLEGGDVLVVGNGIVLIGLSERSTPQAIELLASALFAKNKAQQVIAVKLPKSRSNMHLDTVLTMLDVDCFTVYPPVIDHIKCWVITPNGKHTLKVRQLTKNLFDYLADTLKLGKEIRIVPTGGNPFQMEREQWNDANNVLAIKPGVVIGYERNQRTIDNMLAANINVLTIKGNELGRGRGGPRCMSCPLMRTDLPL